MKEVIKLSPNQGGERHALHRHCEARTTENPDRRDEKGFPIKSPECNEAGMLLMSLFELGWQKPEELKALLAFERGEKIWLRMKSTGDI
ncbi:hypothetical protein [Mesorhizobium sp. CN2-181]|uniref:hypothetical protein n=1 Tax=Mesorhizobium yinganensis TaxID=3157707 RepID=UPI0032B83759